MWRLLGLVLAGWIAATAHAQAVDETVRRLQEGAAAKALVAEQVRKAHLGEGAMSEKAWADLLALRSKQEDNRFREIVVVALMTVLSLAVVLFALRFHARAAPAVMVNAAGLIFIVSGTIILTLLADTEAQLTAATGILGAVAGYMFGSARREAEHRADKT